MKVYRLKSLCILAAAAVVFCILCGCSIFSRIADNNALPTNTDIHSQIIQSAEPTPTATPVPAPTATPVPIQTAQPMTPMEQAVSESQTALMTDQIVLVVDHNLSLWERNEEDIWECRMDIYCGYGSNGLADADTRTEGSKTTPIGSFPLTFAFGTAEDPGSGMDYRQITENSYWSDQNDETYNTWVESSSYISGEHLIDYYQYKYCLAIGFNADPVVYGRGSAIFVHCKSYDHWSTAGCVSLEESDMLSLLQDLRNGAYIIIVPQLSDVAFY